MQEKNLALMNIQHQCRKNFYWLRTVYFYVPSNLYHNFSGIKHKFQYQKRDPRMEPRQTTSKISCQEL